MHLAQHVAIIITFNDLSVLPFVRLLVPPNSSAFGPSVYAIILTIRKVVGVAFFTPFGLFTGQNFETLWRIWKLCPPEDPTYLKFCRVVHLDRSATRPCTEQGPPHFPCRGATQLATGASLAAADVNIAAAQAAATFWCDCVKE